MSAPQPLPPATAPSAGSGSGGTNGPSSAGAATASINGVPVTELFWSLVEKADRRFSRVRDLPLYGRFRNDAEFTKAFRIYTQLWKMQQEHRQRLVEAGLRRWEVGEIASRIAQLYYGQYRRTADSAFLAEAFVFYEAVLDRDYFGAAGGGDATMLANKQLRFLARFLVVALVLGRREMATRLAGQLKDFLEDCRRSFQESEYKEWKHVVREIVRFFKADTAFMNMRPLRYSYVYDPSPDSFISVPSLDKSRNLVLSDAILSSYHHNEVKFTDLTIDTFRMLQCLEWEPCGSFALNNSYGTPSESGHNRSNLLQDLRDVSLPPNPQKTILYRPSATHFLTVLATKCEELSSKGILLIYLSAAGDTEPSGACPDTADKIEGSFRRIDMTHRTTSPDDSPARSTMQNNNNISKQDSMADKRPASYARRGSPRRDGTAQGSPAILRAPVLRLSIVATLIITKGEAFIYRFFKNRHEN